MHIFYDVFSSAPYFVHHKKYVYIHSLVLIRVNDKMVVVVFQIFQNVGWTLKFL